MPSDQPAFGPSLSEIVIADRLSDANQVRIRGVSDLVVSWELSYAGQLTCEIPWADLRCYGYSNPLQLKGKWLHYEHPTAGPWGGLVVGAPGSDGYIAINAESWAAALKGITTQRSAGDSFGLVAELRRQLDLARPLTGIGLGVFDLGGSDVSISGEPVGDTEDLYESFLPRVLERWEDANGWRTGQLQAAGWNINPMTRQFRFDATAGEDRSLTVGLLDGRHNTHGEYGDDLEDIVNRVHLSGTVNHQWTETIHYRNEKGKRRTRTITHSGTARHNAIAVNAVSASRYGIKSLVLQEDHRSASAMDSEALRRVTFLAREERPVTVECADVDLWRKFREGDIVGVDLALSGVRGRMVVRRRSLEVARGVMMVSGEADLG